MRKYSTSLLLSVVVLFLIGCKSPNNSTGPDKVRGCTDISACNFRSDATENDDSCAFEEDCNGECGGTALLDVCGDCGGNITVEEDCPIIWNIYYDISDTLAGFQFDITGVTVIGVSGGATEEAGFMISLNATTVLGFSLGGNTIPEGSGLFIVLELEGDEASACIINIPTNPLIISDPEGNQIDAEIINCNTIKY